MSLSVLAQDQMVVRLNEEGLLKILRSVVEQKTADVKARSFTIPKDLYAFSIPREQLLSNPIIPIINEISNLNLNKDLPFYLNTSDIKLSGSLDSKSLKVTILNSSSKGFDVKISLDLPSVDIQASRLSLCEDVNSSETNCGDGLKVEISNLRIKTITRPASVSIVLRLRTDNNVARFKVISVDSNLDDALSPRLDINKFSINIPKISIVINGQERA